MIAAIIIDDESHCLVTLSMLLDEYCPEVSILEQCNSAKRGLEAIEKHQPALVFLDIEMPTMNGFEMLEHVNYLNFFIIFTTSYDQYAIKAIRFSALDYLLKPVDPKELEIASFEQVAEECGESRVYGGIHYQQSVDIGHTAGQLIGNAAAALHTTN